MRRDRLVVPLLLAAGTACPTSPGRLSPPTASTAVTVGSNTLVPLSTFMFDSPAEYWSTIAVTDHPAACGELSMLSSCRPESWVGVRGYADSPPSVRTAVVIGLGFSWPPPAGFTGTPSGTYAVSPSCQFPFASTGQGGANAAFIVHDAAGRAVVVDEAVGGTVVLEEIASGQWAAGSYSLVLESGAAIRGDFAGAYCPAVSAHVQGPCCPEPWTLGQPDESCSCGGVSASSSCSQPTTGSPWTCHCINSDGSTSTCTLPPDARTLRPLCSQRYVTCCPMCP